MYDDNSWYESDDDIDNAWYQGDDDNSGEFYNPPNREDIED